MSEHTLYDMVSDTATVPTDAMFDLMKHASRGDDVYSTDTSVKELESYVAELLGHEAGLFCVSGCMTNQLGLRVLLTQPPHSVLCDVRSHVFNYECGGIAYHSQASVSPVPPQNKTHLTAKDVEAHLVTDDLCGALTKVISLENTLNGTIMPLEAMAGIHDVARRHGIKMHLDGARLWNASQETGVPMHDYGRLFDTVSVCLSKGVGAPIGSVLVGSAALIQRARHLRKLMGGGWRQAGPLAAVALHCIHTVVPTMRDTHMLARRLASALESLGFGLTLPCHTNMIFLDTSPLNLPTRVLATHLKEQGILISGNDGYQTRVAFHYQVTSEAVDRFIAVATKLAQAMAEAVTAPRHCPTNLDQVVFRSAYPSSATTST